MCNEKGCASVYGHKKSDFNHYTFIQGSEIPKNTQIMTKISLQPTAKKFERSFLFSPQIKDKIAVICYTV